MPVEVKPVLPAPSPSQLAEMYSRTVEWMSQGGGALHEDVAAHLYAQGDGTYRREGRREKNRLYHLLFVLRAFDIYTVVSADGRDCAANFYVSPGAEPIAPPGFLIRADGRFSIGRGFDGAPVRI